MWFWREVVDDIPLRPENFRILHPEIIHKTGQVLQKYALKQGNVSSNITMACLSGLICPKRYIDNAWLRHVLAFSQAWELRE